MKQKLSLLRKLHQNRSNHIFSSDLLELLREYINESKAEESYIIVSVKASLDGTGNDLCVQIVRCMSKHPSFDNETFNSLYEELCEEETNCHAHKVTNAWDKILNFVRAEDHVLFVFESFDRYASKISGTDDLRLDELYELKNVSVWFCGSPQNINSLQTYTKMQIKCLRLIDNKTMEKIIETSDMPHVYVTYNWEKTSDIAVNHLIQNMELNGINLIRDKKDCKPGENIKTFMNAIREGRIVVLMLSKAYFESENCMYELSGIMQHPDCADRLIPICCDDSVRNDEFYIELIKKWKNKIAKHQKNVDEMEEIDPEQAGPLKRKLKEVNDVYAMLKDIKNYIDYANAYDSARQSDENFSGVIENIKNKLEKLIDT